MNKKDDPNSIWYEGPFFDEEPQSRGRSVATARVQPSDKATLAGTGGMQVIAAAVRAIASPLTGAGGLVADAQATPPTLHVSVRRSRASARGGPMPRAEAVGRGLRRAGASADEAIPEPRPNSAAPNAGQADADEIATLHEVLGPPQLKGESLAAYNRLYAAVRCALNPSDIVDEMDAREIVDAAWLLRQYKSGRAGALDGAFEDAVADVIKDRLSEAWIRSNAKRRSAGDPAAHGKMRQRLVQAGVSEETLRGRVLEEHLDSVERFEALIDKLLDRRARLLQEMARRRDQHDPPQ